MFLRFSLPGTVCGSQQALCRVGCLVAVVGKALLEEVELELTRALGRVGAGSGMHWGVLGEGAERRLPVGTRLDPVLGADGQSEGCWDGLEGACNSGLLMRE